MKTGIQIFLIGFIFCSCQNSEHNSGDSGSSATENQSQNLSIIPIPKESIQNNFSISGRVHTVRGLPIEGAEVFLKRFDLDAIAVEQTIVDKEGNYKFNNLKSSKYIISIKYLDQDPLAGLDENDEALMNSYVLGASGLNFFQLLASDCNASKTVTTLDMALIHKIILGHSTSCSKGKSWLFVANDLPVGKEWGLNEIYNEKIVINSLTANQSKQNFIGVKFGDIDSSWGSDENRQPAALDEEIPAD